MLKFEKQGPKSWNIIYGKNEPLNVLLSPSSVTNKFHIITDYITRVAEYHGEAFSEWFINLLKDCQDSTKRASAVVDNVEALKLFSDTYLDSIGFDYTQFVDITKAKKNSILFQADEIQEIIRLSCYLLYYIYIF